MNRRIVIASAMTLVIAIAGIGFAPAAGASDWRCKGVTRFVPFGCRVAKIGHQTASPVADGTGIVVEGTKGVREATEAAADVASGAQAITEVGRLRLEQWREEQARLIERQRQAAATSSTVASVRWVASPDGRLCQLDSGVCVARTTCPTIPRTACGVGSRRLDPIYDVALFSSTRLPSGSVR